MAFVRGHHLRHHGDAEAGFHHAQHGAWLREFENDVGCNFQPGERPVGNRIIAGDIFAIRQPTIYPWIVPHERQSQKLEDFPHLKRWFETIRKRPATIRAYAVAKTVNPTNAPTVNEKSKKILFGQAARK
jgi:glutathione S-transferase